MNKLTIIAASAVICILGAIAYVALQPSRPGPFPTQTTKKINPAPQPAKLGSSMQPGSYEAYASEKITATSNTKILFFHAPWCPQCRKLENDIKMQGVPEGVSIFKVDYDSNQALRKRYGVTIQTTMVKIDDQGNLVEKYVAYDEPTFANVGANLLP
ncbi:MAG TPA: thioredoxin family protein [Candidatus Saccharimonadia bacterium]